MLSLEASLTHGHSYPRGEERKSGVEERRGKGWEREGRERGERKGVGEGGEGEGGEERGGRGRGE